MFKMIRNRTTRLVLVAIGIMALALGLAGMAAAIEVLGGSGSRPRILVAGEMLELGEQAVELQEYPAQGRAGRVMLPVVRQARPQNTLSIRHATCLPVGLGERQEKRRGRVARHPLLEPRELGGFGLTERHGAGAPGRRSHG